MQVEETEGSGGNGGTQGGSGEERSRDEMKLAETQDEDPMSWEQFLQDNDLPKPDKENEYPFPPWNPTELAQEGEDVINGVLADFWTSGTVRLKILKALRQLKGMIQEAPEEYEPEKLSLFGEKILASTAIDLCNISYIDVGVVPALKDKIKQIETNAFCAPFVVVVQSSGYGKTRAILELGLERKVVYLLWSRIAGGMHVPHVIETVKRRFGLQNKEAYPVDILERVACKLLTTIVEMMGEFSAEDLRKSQFTKDGNFGPFYKCLEEKFKENLTPPTSPCKENEKLPEEIGKSESKLIVVFDESKCLLKASTSTGQTPYQAIRRICRRAGIIAIFLDTSSKIADFLPQNAASNREITEGGLSFFLPPLIDIPTFDILAVPKDESYYAHLFTLGRPLWASYFKFQAKGLKDLVLFALSKLAGSEHESARNYALFCARFGMGSESKVAQELTAHNMATLVGVKEDNSVVHAKYLSEPILAEASAYYTSSDSAKAKCVVETCATALDAGLLEAPKGDRGEMAGAAALGYVMDQLRCLYSADDNNMSRPVFVLDFLKSLGAKIPKDARDELDGYVMNFTHFYRSLAPLTQKYLKIYYERHAAWFSYPGAEGIDAGIPIFHDARGLSSIRVQIKNFKAKIGDSTARGFLAKLAPHCCHPFTNVKFSVALLLVVGSGGVSTLCTVEDVGLRRSPRTNFQPQKNQQLWVTASLSKLSIPVVKELEKLAGQPRDMFIVPSLLCSEGPAFAEVEKDFEASK